MDNRGSKNSCLPSSTLAGSVMRTGAIGVIGSCLGVAITVVAVSVLNAVMKAVLRVTGFMVYSVSLDNANVMANIKIVFVVRLILIKFEG
ncbi:hypothetical protein [Teredinibacter turnerae]|uniref:hypothetical protein n=1 Tax=Teredinibacter turnerae TaxID=2426 RepID=UPI001E4FB541|nr:hypothetical protein [Teredinibacter turnerae]